MKYNLEERLIAFAIIVISIVTSLPRNRVGNHLGGQLIRSGTSPALHYGEVQSAESRNDFIHKMRVVLKEMRETLICLKIIDRISLTTGPEQVKQALTECNELIAIFVASIGTAESNRED